MNLAAPSFSPRRPAPLILAAVLATAFWACAGSYEEIISEVAVPIPKAMTKSPDKPAQMSIFGFSAGQASFHGDMPVDKIVEFYKKELPERGWQPNVNIQGGGSLLAYSKDGKSLLINAARENDRTVLSITVAGVGK